MKKYIYLSSIFLMKTLCSQSLDDYRHMDEIATRCGADKGSHYHNYTEVYSKYFAPIQDLPLKFLEIGIYKGSSVKMWEEYLPSAELHFADITFERVEYFSQRSHYHICNQENPKDLRKLMKKTGGNFDVILDDGGHTMKQQITSLVTLFPYVKSGGMYIVEDLHTSYWPGHFGGGGSDSAIAFLKSLIDEVNFVGAKTTRASHLALDPQLLSQLNIFQKEILSIHFYDSVAILIKR